MATLQANKAQWARSLMTSLLSTVLFVLISCQLSFKVQAANSGDLAVQHVVMDLCDPAIDSQQTDYYLPAAFDFTSHVQPSVSYTGPASVAHASQVSPPKCRAPPTFL